MSFESQRIGIVFYNDHNAEPYYEISKLLLEDKLMQWAFRYYDPVIQLVQENAQLDARLATSLYYNPDNGMFNPIRALSNQTLRDSAHNAIESIDIARGEGIFFRPSYIIKDECVDGRDTDFVTISRYGIPFVRHYVEHYSNTEYVFAYANSKRFELGIACDIMTNDFECMCWTDGLDEWETSAYRRLLCDKVIVLYDGIDEETCEWITLRNGARVPLAYADSADGLSRALDIQVSQMHPFWTRLISLWKEGSPL